MLESLGAGALVSTFSAGAYPSDKEVAQAKLINSAARES
jgi:hypothetical protein